jgi:hypothetical protein
MLIDCDACGVRGPGCADCVITALIGAPPVGVELTALPTGVELDDVERAALDVFAAAGLDPRFLAVTGATEIEESGPERRRANWLGAGSPEAERARRRAG